MDKTNQKLKLKDGRMLCYAEYGIATGIPIFHFNGSGGSRLEHPVDTSIFEDLNIRYITTDRPGHGNSTLLEERTLLSWAEDIRELADFLELKKFYLLGWSAGGPHALACAHQMPDRVIATSVVCGLAPANRPNPFEGYKGLLRLMMIWGRKYPKLIFSFRRMISKKINASSKTFGKQFIKSMPKVDQVVFEQGGLADMLIADVAEGYKQGGDGPAIDDVLINADWGFNIENIKSRVDVWQGDQDRNVPLNQGKYQASLLPNANLYIQEGKGHMLLLSEWRTILEKLINLR